jgi:DNA-directed RNA polymerase specialized sigma24 family protein
MKGERSVEQLDPEALVMPRNRVERLQRALEELPVDFREVIVLRELKGLSYREIAAVTGTPIETVVSRLTRGRERLLAVLKAEPTTEGAVPAKLDTSRTACEISEARLVIAWRAGEIFRRSRHRE